jgi:hypothetical protein
LEKQSPAIQPEMNDLTLLERVVPADKKIEQDQPSRCQKSKYLTLLNSFENATTRDRQGTGEYL